MKGEIDKLSTLTPTVHLEEGAKVVNSVSDPYDHRFRNCNRKCLYGPYTSIGSNVRIVDAEIENSYCGMKQHCQCKWTIGWMFARQRGFNYLDYS